MGASDEIETFAEDAAKAIWADLSDRRGIGDELTGCDEDIQHDIYIAIVGFVLTAIRKARGED